MKALDHYTFENKYSHLENILFLKWGHRLHQAALILTAFLFLSLATASYGENSQPENKTASKARSFRAVLDNDVFVPGERDQDYTGGLSLAYSSSDLNKNRFYVGSILNSLDEIFNLPQGSNNYYTIEAGLYGFTPEDAKNVHMNPNDRPYASILYFSNSHQRIDQVNQVAWQSTFTLGILGLDFFGSAQNEIHDISNNKPAVGWGHQISDGGEITARYQISRQSAFKIPSDRWQVNFTQQLSIGYLTEVSVGLSTRFGKIDSNWWNFQPELANYGEQRSGEMAKRNESYFFAGLALKARAYNAFLQGQARSSDVSYSSDEVNHGLAEFWAGYSQSLGNNYQLSYIIRGHTSELKQGIGDRNVLWGGLVLSKSWR